MILISNFLHTLLIFLRYVHDLAVSSSYPTHVFVIQVHDRAKISDSESQAALSKIQKMESNLQNNDKEIHLLQSQLDQVEKDRSCLLAAVALVSGVLIPQLARQAELVSNENMYGA